MAGELRAGDVVVGIIADLTEFKKGLQQTKEEVSGLAKNIKEQFSAMGKQLLGLFAVEKLLETGVDLVKHFAQVQQALFLLGQQVTRSGGNWLELRQGVLDYLEVGEQTTLFNKVEMANSLRELLVLTGNLRDAMGLNNLAMKLAKVAQIDLMTASTQVGLAFQGNTRGIHALAKELGMAGAASTDVQKVFEELEKKSKDVNPEVETLTTSWHKYTVEIEEATKGTGAFLGGVFQKLLSTLGSGMRAQRLYNEAIQQEKFASQAARIEAEYRDNQGKLGEIQARAIWTAARARLVEEFEKEKELDVLKMATSAADLARKAAANKIRDEELKRITAENAEVKKLSEEVAAAGTEQERFTRDVQQHAVTIFDLFKGLSTETAKIDRLQGEALDHYKARVKDVLQELKQETQTKAAELKKFADTIANGIGADLQAFVSEMKAGTKELVQVFEVLGKSIAKSLINAVGDALIQQGAADIFTGLADLINPLTAAAAPGFLASGALKAAGGGTIKGVAATFMAEGGIIMPRTGGVPVIAAEAGKPEVFAPLDKLKEMLDGKGAGDLTVNGGITFNFPGVRRAADFTTSDQANAARGLINTHKEMLRRQGLRAKI